MALTKKVKQDHLNSYNELIKKIVKYVPNKHKQVCLNLSKKHVDNFETIYDINKKRFKDLNKIKNAYDQLKESVKIIEECEIESQNLATTSLDKCKEYLIEIDNQITNQKVNTLLKNYETGEVLKLLKDRYCESKPIFENEIRNLELKNCGSVSYAYQLIKFYELCCDYKYLKYTTLGIKKILTHLSDFEKHMKDDKEFWNTAKTNSDNNNSANSNSDGNNILSAQSENGSEITDNTQMDIDDTDDSNFLASENLKLLNI